MQNINENVANNIIKLRKTNKMTQQDLANKLNYSDKAISKWERGDSIPDIEMLCNIATIFNVNVDYLTKEHSDEEIRNTNSNSQLFLRNLLITIMIGVSIFFLATVIFVGAILKNSNLAKTMWVTYIYALPLCSLVAYLYAKKSNYWLMRLISISCFTWTFITSIYCTTLISGYTSFWLFYIVGVPIEAAICLFHFWKKTF